MSFRNPVRSPLLQRGVTGGGVEGAYARPSDVGSEIPHIVPWTLCTVSAPNLGGWYVGRVKKTPGVRYVCNNFFGPVAVNISGGTVSVAAAVYIFETNNGVIRLRQLRHHEWSSANAAYMGAPQESGFNGTDAFISDRNPLILEPDRHYAIASWVGSAACATTGCTALVPDASLTTTNIANRAYSATESSNQKYLRLDSRDTGDGLILGFTGALLPYCALGVKEDVTYMY